MPTFGFTPRTLANLKPPAPGPNGKVAQVDYYDASEAGLHLRVSSTGNRTWMVAGRVLRNGQRKLARFKLGPAPTPGNPRAMSLSDARTAAAKLKADLKNGVDPLQRDRDAERELAEASTKTFEAAAKTFLAQYPKRKGLRPATVRQYRDFLEGQDFALLKKRPLASITKSDITRALDRIQERKSVKKGVRANRALASAKVMFRWYVGRGDLAVDPTQGMKPPVAESKRARHLFGSRDKPSELALLWRAFDRCGTPYAQFLKILMLTGMRRNEASCLRWDELVDLDTENPYALIPGDRIKNHRGLHMPLGKMAAELLRSVPRVIGEGGHNCPFVFTVNGQTAINGFSKLRTKTLDPAVAAVIAEDPERYKSQMLAPWTLHDLRRTFKTGLKELRVDEDVRDALLNHARTGVDAHYDHAELDTAKREGMEAWERHIAACLLPPNENVIPLRAAAR
jgi:integrase